MCELIVLFYSTMKNNCCVVECVFDYVQKVLVKRLSMEFAVTMFGW